MNSARPPHFFGSAVVVFLLTILNRCVGYARDIFLTAVLGVGLGAQLFVLSFRAFGVVRALISESAIPAYVVKDYLRSTGGMDAEIYVRKELAGWNGVFVILLILFLFVFPFYCSISIALIDLQSSWVLYLFFLVTAVGISGGAVSAFFASVAQANEKFVTHSVLPIYPNLCFVVMFLFLWLVDSSSVNLILLSISSAFLLCFLLQYLSGLFFISRRILVDSARIIFSVDFVDAVRKIKSMRALSIFTVTSPLISVFAGILQGQGGLSSDVTHFFVAERIVQIIPGTVGYAISVVLLPKFLKKSGVPNATASEQIILAGVMLSAVLSIALVYVFGFDAVKLLYSRAKFTEHDSVIAGSYLQITCFAIFPLMVENFYVPKFIARARDFDLFLVAGMTFAAIFVTYVLMFFLQSYVIRGDLIISVFYVVASSMRVFFVVSYLKRVRND